jgi:Putative Actinobacterial Holin-X, holin superfamily III
MQQKASEGGAAIPRQDHVAQDRPIGEIVTQLSAQMSRLVREEMQLARLEMTQKGKRAGFGVGMFGAGGLTALYGIAAVLAAVILLLARVMPAWGGALVVGGVLLAVSAGLALAGRKQLQHAAPPAPQQTADSVRADVEEIKERAHR